jgi:hypothetical protein
MKRARRRCGVVLILVLVVVALLALAAYTFTDLMLSERAAVELHGEQMQAARLADSGVERVRHFLRQDAPTRHDEGGWYDNPDWFRGILVIDDEDASWRGRFTAVAPNMDDDGRLGGLRYGLEDESTRLNLNALLAVDEVAGQNTEQLPDEVAEANAVEGARDLLMALPGMTVETADAILDWIDEDDEVRTYGAEADHYSGLDPPYGPRNGPLLSVEELLLVRGVTPDLLFGRDVNRNGMIDPHEEGTTLDIDVDNFDGSMDRGWSAYLTLYSMEANANSLGERRIYLNQEDMQQLYDELSVVFPPDWATFIVAYRQEAPYYGSEEGEAVASGSLDLTRPGRAPITQVLDLIGARVRVKYKDDDKTKVLESPFLEGPIAMRVYLPQLMDHVTVNPDPIIPGRININQAARTILQGIPGMSDEIVDAIISNRQPESAEDDPNRDHECWLLTDGIVTLSEMKLLMPFVTAGGDVYRAQVVGYYESGGVAARHEVVIDATVNDPRVVFWRNLSHLGRGYALETLGTEIETE